MRIPSVASCFQCSVVSSSTSFAIFEYKEKRGPEMSPKFDCLCNRGVGIGGSAGAGNGSGD
jgi:hypothetical protein